MSTVLERIALVSLAVGLPSFLLGTPPLAAMGAALLLAGAAVVPPRGLLAALAAVPLEPLTRSGGLPGASIAELAILGAAVGTIFWQLAPITARPTGWRLTATPFDRPAAVFLLGALLSLLVSEYLRLSLRELRTLILEPLLLFYLLVGWFGGRGALQPVVAFLVGTTGIALVGLVGYALGVGVTEAEGVRRLQGIYPSPNHFGLLLGRALPWLTSLALLAPSGRLLFRTATLPVAAALVATFSLGAWVGSAAALLVLLWYLGGARRLALGCALLALAGVSALALLPVERVWSHLEPGGATTFFRLRLWESSLAMIRDHLILGVGLDNFLYLYQQRYIDPRALAEANLSHPHNLVLHFWLQLGLPGLVAAVWVLAAAGRLAYRQLRRHRHDAASALTLGGVGGLADFVVHGLVDNSYFLPDLALVFWLTLATVAISTRAVR